MVPTHLIRPYENNVKQHPVYQLESLMQSIREFGFLQPLVIDKDNIIIAGHARFEAASTLGISDLPCIMAENLTDKQIKAYRILDNKIAELGTTDPKLLKIEIEVIPDFDFKPFNIELPQFKVELPPIEDIKTEKTIECPQCHHQFTKSECN